jgi:hypothetical protein
MFHLNPSLSHVHSEVTTNCTVSPDLIFLPLNPQGFDQALGTHLLRSSALSFSLGSANERLSPRMFRIMLEKTFPAGGHKYVYHCLEITLL